MVSIALKKNNGALTFVKHIGLQDGLKSTCVPYLFFDKEKNEMMACTRKGLSRFILQGTDSDIKKSGFLWSRFEELPFLIE